MNVSIILLLKNIIVLLYISCGSWTKMRKKLFL